MEEGVEKSPEGIFSDCIQKVYDYLTPHRNEIIDISLKLVKCRIFSKPDLTSITEGFSF